MANVNVRKITLDDLLLPDLVFELDGQEVRVPGEALTTENLAKLAQALAKLEKVTEGVEPFSQVGEIERVLREDFLKGPRVPLNSVMVTYIAARIIEHGAGLPLAERISETLSGKSSATASGGPSTPEPRGSGGRTRK